MIIYISGCFVVAKSDFSIIHYNIIIISIKIIEKNRTFLSSSS